MATGRGDDGSDDQWRFSLEDLEETDGEAEETRESDGNIAGEFVPDARIEAGDIDPENALFVLLGVGVAVAVLAGFVLFL